jgi:hypothetical protein
MLAIGVEIGLATVERISITVIVATSAGDDGAGTGVAGGRSDIRREAAIATTATVGDIVVGVCLAGVVGRRRNGGVAVRST